MLKKSLGALLVLGLMLGGCGGGDSSNVTVVNAKDGLNIQALCEVVQKAKDAEDLEKKLNEPGQKVNNLDLDEDGKVDYVGVTEFTKGKTHGFSFTVSIGGEKQEVATVQIEENSDGTASVEAQGNQHVYGHGHYYHSRIGVGDLLLFHYLTRPHTPYASRYSSYSPPSYYAPQTTRPVDTYRSDAAAMTKNSSFKSGGSTVIVNNAPSPNAGATSRYVKAPLSSPTTAQRSYQTSNPSKYSSTSRSSYSGSSRGGSSYGGRSGGSGGGK